jgi:hypothetical protein
LEPPITTWNEPSDERLTEPAFGTPLADDETFAIFAGFPTNLTATPWNPDGLPISTWPPVCSVVGDRIRAAGEVCRQRREIDVGAPDDSDAANGTGGASRLRDNFRSKRVRAPTERKEQREQRKR